MSMQGMWKFMPTIIEGHMKEPFSKTLHPHELSAKRHSGEKPHQCKKCRQSFPWR